MEVSSAEVETENGAFETNFPILGHDTFETDGYAEMTDAIDVVFYKGGEIEVSGFELGKDLLWFFLSPSKVIAAENSVNEKGDLVLDFGDIGTLTFLGLVAQDNGEIFI